MNMKYFNPFLLAAIFVLFVIIPVRSASATTLFVPKDFPNIQAAIDAAKNGDQITVADGTYTGPGNKDIRLRGKAILVTSESGAESCTIDVGGRGRGFIFDAGEGADTVVSGFTIINANPQDNSYSRSGGAIICFNSYPTLDHLILRDNIAYDGGGIFIQAPESGPEHSMMLSNIEFYQNTAERQGSALRGCGFSVSITMLNCVMIGNHALLADTIGLYHADAKLQNVLVADNTSDKSNPGVSIDWCSVTMEHVTLVNNSIEKYDYHGALSLGYTSYVNLKDSIIWGNSHCNIGFSREWSHTMTLDISYSLLEGGVDSICEVDIGTVHKGRGIIDANPLFVKGPLSQYYLSQTAAGQSKTSPAVDAGSDLVENKSYPAPWGKSFLSDLTTRTDHVSDSGMADLGYHFPPLPCTLAVFFQDLDKDGFGNSDIFMVSCEPATGFVTKNGDCNDLDASVNPDAYERNDGIDNDCDTITDEPIICGMNTTQAHLFGRNCLIEMSLIGLSLIGLLFIRRQRA
jgi:hypothetical protein